jgi:hypothetical protein
MQAQVYSVIKDLDPYHATIGAANCGSSFLFRDIPSLLPATVNRSTAWMEHGQPALQLSLDLVMQVRTWFAFHFGSRLDSIGNAAPARNKHTT